MREDIATYYINNTVTVTEAATHFNTSYATAYRSIASHPQIPRSLILARKINSLRNRKRSTPSPRRSLSNAQAVQAFQLLLSGTLQKEIAKQLDVEPSVISRLSRGETYRELWATNFRGKKAA